MATTARVSLSVEVLGPQGVEFSRALPPVTFALGVGSHAQTDKVSLTGSASTTLTVPSGAKLALVELGSAVSLTWKGISADTGTTIAPASAPLGCDMLIPLGATPAIVITNGSSDAQTISVTWF